MPKSKPFRRTGPRKPPRPDSWSCDRGTCRFCGAAILNSDGTSNRRKHWHSACGKTWKIMNNPREARKYVFAKFKGECQSCHCLCIGLPWHCDHHEPLHEAFGDPTYWAPENLRLLCKRCHYEKTIEEMRKFSLVKGLVEEEFST